MRATWRVTSASSMPQACGSSNARMIETCRPPSTIAARRISVPPFSSAVGGAFNASNFAIAASPIADGLGGLDHLGDRGQRKLFEIGRVGHRYVLAGDARDRRVEI